MEAGEETPEFRKLTDGESRALLERNHVGRLAYSFKDRVGITPLHYVYSEGFLYGRTGPWYTIKPGVKQSALLHNQWVAFEVDEVEDLFSWRSVVVHGAFHSLLPDYPEDQELRDHAIELLRTIIPATFREHDPTPFRDMLFRIEVQEMAGREARPATPGDAERDEGKA